MEAPAPAQSQYLPGTKIQFAWDSTCLGDLKKCPRYYQYTHIDGWTPKDESIHLRFGQEYHQALHDYEIGRAAGASHDEALRVAIRDLLVRCQDYPDVDPNDRPSVRVKTRANLVRTVVWYVEQFKDDPAETVQIKRPTTRLEICEAMEGAEVGESRSIPLEQSEPAMEVSFKFELDWGPRWGTDPFGKDAHVIVYMANGTIAESNSQPYLLCGHLDRLVTFNDETFVMDRKTATTTLSQHYFDQYSPHNQMSLYAIAGQVVLGTSIRGVIIDAAAIQVGGSWYQRGFTYRTQGQLDEWLHDLHYWFRQAEQYATDNYWPMNDTACSMYGGCRFREVCSKDPAVRERFLAAQFVKRPEADRWNPLKPR